MEKSRVKYNVAIELKSKGFNQEVDAAFSKESGKFIFTDWGNIQSNDDIDDILIPLDFNLQNDSWLISAPTYQQVVDWFRISHGLVLDVFQEFNGEDAYTGFWEVDISELGVYKNPHKIIVEDVFEDYYKAWDKAIEEALKHI